MLLDAGGNGEDVRIEYDVLWRKIHLVDENPVCPFAYSDFLLHGFRLTLLVEGHDHDPGSVAFHQARLFDEGFFSLLEADGIDEALALDALEAGFDDRPLGRVDHYGDATDIGLGGNEAKELAHGGFGIQHALVHVDVDDLGAVLHLLTGNADSGIVITLDNEPRELSRPCDVGAFTDVDEQAVGVDGHRFQSGETAHARRLRDAAWFGLCNRLGNSTDMFRCGSAASTHQVQKTGCREFSEHFRHVLRRVVVAPELVGKPGIGVATDMGLGGPGEIIHIGPQLGRAQSAIEADGQRPRVAYRVPECLHRLSGQGASAEIGNGSRDHQW